MNLSTGDSEKIVFNALEIVQIECGLDNYKSYTLRIILDEFIFVLRLKIINIDQLLGYSRLSNL